MTTSNWLVNLVTFAAVITFLIVQQQRGMNWRGLIAGRWGVLSLSIALVSITYMIWAGSIVSAPSHPKIHAWGIIFSICIWLIAALLIYLAVSERHSADITQDDFSKGRAFLIGVVLSDRAIAVVAILCRSLWNLSTNNEGYAWGELTASAALFVLPFALINLILLGVVLSKTAPRNNGEVKISEQIKTKFNKLFSEPAEQYIASIGNGYIVNFLSGSGFESGFAAISNKRVYFRGKCYYLENGKVKRNFEERVVDLKDVTGTGYTRVDPLYLVAFSFISLLVTILSLIQTESMQTWRVFLLIIALASYFFFLLRYFLNRRDYFEIAFAGGRIAFDINLYAKSEIDDFQKQLRIAKDNVVETAPVQKAAEPPIVQHGNSSTADELKKYAELYQQNLITDHEYAEIKRKLLSGQKI